MSGPAASGAERTTDEVLAGKDLRDLEVLVTGATAGLGLETARALAAHGASVTLAGRGEQRLQEAVAGIAATTGSTRLGWLDLDLASFASVRAAARRYAAEHERLNLLINNAGVMACPLGYTNDGHEMQFGVCHLGHFLFTCELVPLLLAGAPARVVNLSSAGHRLSPVIFEDIDFRNRVYDKWESYGQAKTANILFSVELNRRLCARGVTANAVHPGAIATTRLGRHLQPEDFASLRARSSGAAYLYKSMEQGAATTVWAATDAAFATRGGLYLEDCGIAQCNDDTTAAVGGYRSYALDPEAAKRLWAVSETLVGQAWNWT